MTYIACSTSSWPYVANKTQNPPSFSGCDESWLSQWMGLFVRQKVLSKFTALKRHSPAEETALFCTELRTTFKERRKNYFKMFFCPQEQYPDRIKEIPISPNVFTLSSHVLFLQRHWTRGSGLEYACRIVMQSKGARLTIASVLWVWRLPRVVHSTSWDYFSRALYIQG